MRSIVPQCRRSSLPGRIATYATPKGHDSRLDALTVSQLRHEVADPEGLAWGERCGYNSQMEKATVSKLKNNLSAYLRKVRSGQPVVIYDRDVPIARIERIETSGRGADRLQLLAAQGITRPAARPLSPRELHALLPRPLPRAARVLDALLDERAHDR